MSVGMEERLRRDLRAGRLPGADAGALVDEAARRSEQRGRRTRLLTAAGATGLGVVVVAALVLRLGGSTGDGTSPAASTAPTVSTIELPASTVEVPSPTSLGDVAASTIEVPSPPTVSTVELPASTVEVPSPTSTPTAAVLDPVAAWQPIAANPLGGRDGAVSVWTGTEALTWGGTDEVGDARADGAAYDPTSNSWRVIAPGEMSPRVGEVAVWTGSEMLVIGGETATGGQLLNQLAAYDPVGDRWSWRATPPFVSVTSEDVVVWIGDALVVWTRDGAAARYDPATDTWTSLPAAPLADRTDAAAVWTGSEVVVWGGLAADGRTNLADGAAFDPVTATWRTMAAAPLGGRVTEAIWTGSEVVLRGGYSGSGTVMALADGATYDPATDTWTTVKQGPAHPGFVGVWTGAVVVEMAKGNAVLWDPATDRWVDPPELSGGPASPQAPLWTGRYVLSFGRSADGNVVSDAGGIALQPSLVSLT